MFFTRILFAMAVVCLVASSPGYADQGSRRGRGHGGRVAVPRPVGGPRHVVPGRPVPYGRYYGPRYGYRPVFRPGLGVGIYIGSPYLHGYVAYGYPYYAASYRHRYGYYGYAAPFPYAAPYPYPYAAHGGIYAVPPPDALYGGVRLDVTPRDAAVYVDGYYAGIVDDFDGAWQRVALEPGAHRFEIVSPGLETLSFDVNVRSNETVRYRGDMIRVVP